MSETDGPGSGISKHKGGSKCALEYAIEIAKEKGLTKEEVAADVFERLHKTSDGDYTDAKSRRIARRMEERMEMLSQSSEGTSELPDVNMSQVFLEAVGGLDKKGRLFSADFMAKKVKASSSYSSVGDQSHNSTAIATMQEQLAAQNEMIAKMMSQLQAQQEQIQSQQTQLNKINPPQSETPPGGL